MSGDHYLQHYSALPTIASSALSVAIDDPAALALRQLALAHDDYPKYLLAVEISALLHYIPDLYQKTLIATLWNTGARINEALALCRRNFSFSSPYPYVSLATLKQRQEKALRGPGAPARISQTTGWRPSEADIQMVLDILGTIPKQEKAQSIQRDMDQESLALLEARNKLAGLI